MPNLTLKVQNVAPLSVLTLFVLSAAMIVTQGQFDKEQIPSLIPAAEALAVTGVIAVCISYLVPADIKHMLVFARFRHALPGHRFVALSEKDPRVSNSALKSLVTPFPQERLDPAWQNQFWYGEIYRPTKNVPEVASTQKSFLLYRDAASIALISIVAIAVFQSFFEPLSNIVDAKGLGAIAVFVCLFLFAANSAGKRFVTTAVAVYLSDVISKAP